MRYPLTVQWHITTNCSNRCKHCYMFDPATYEAERDGTLAYEDLIRVLDRFDEFAGKYEADFSHYAITGGDPLLRKEWPELVAELRRRGKTVTMMGNPETLTEESVERLAALGVSRFQLSLDGLEELHDTFRSPGSFARAVDKLALLSRHGIQSQVMFTLYPTNRDHLIPLMRFVASQTQARSFTFDVGCFVGNGAALERGISPGEIQRIFANYLAEKTRLQAEGYALQVREKSHLLNLVRFADGTYYPFAPTGVPALDGCLVGWTCLAILADGAVLACRRMPLKVGKLPEQTVEEILLGNPLLRKFRRPESFPGCGGCDFYKVCRGCPANAHSLTGDAFSTSPFCFRNTVDRASSEASHIQHGPPLSISNEEEWAFMQSRFAGLAPMRESVAREAFRNTFLDLKYDPSRCARFLEDPRQYAREEAAGLLEADIFNLLELFSPGRHFLFPHDAKSGLRDRIELAVLRKLKGAPA